MSRIFFGVGHGFGGLRRLSKILDSLKPVSCGYEIKNEDSPKALYDSYIDVYNEEADSKSLLIRERLFLVQNIIKNKLRFGEMNGVLSFFIDSLHELWPGAKFIHLIRDPRDQIRISYNLGAYDSNFCDVGLYPCPRKNDPFYYEWKNMDNLEKCAWMWVCVNSVILKHFENVPQELVLRIKFENFICGTIFSDLCGFLKIPKPEEEIISKFISARRPDMIARVSRPLPKWENMEERDKEKICNIVGNLSTQIDYDLKEE
jgi:hypothetical protein